jgi:hypothetical protein
MGWWNAAGKEEVIIGDEGLDETYHYLRRMGELYREALSRTMTIEEFKTTLEISLRTNGDDTLFSGFEEREVVAVTIKLGKRAKRQKYQVGDLFAIPLGEGKFAFGRIMSVSKDGSIVEIFRYVSDGIRESPDIGKSGRLFHPIYISATELFQTGQWRIIASDTNYVPEDLPSLKFVYGTSGDRKVVQGNRERHISDDEAAGLEGMSFWSHEPTVRRIKAALGL